MVGGGAAGQSNQNRKQRKAPVDFGKGKGVPVTRPESLLHPLQYTHTHTNTAHFAGRKMLALGNNSPQMASEKRREILY